MCAVNRTRQIGALICLIMLAAIAAHPSRLAAQATYTTEFDAQLTVSATGRSESLDGWGEVVSKSE